jgi:thymidylate synthase ThyX
MSKTATIHELTNLLAIALRHRIGSIVNKDAVYAQKYAMDAEVFMKEAKKIALQEHWNTADKEEIKRELQKKLKDELIKKTFLNEKKFEYMEKEIEKALEELNL